MSQPSTMVNLSLLGRQLFWRVSSVIVAALTLFVVTRHPVEADETEGEQRGPRFEAAAEIGRALEEVAKLSAPAELLQRFRATAAAVTEKVPANVLVRKLFQAADQTAKGGQAEQVRAWKSALKEAQSLLRFKPLDEAPLPDGFPECVPPGEIRVQAYPAYRIARTATGGLTGENGAFWTLFNHIKSAEIAMTAPVEMTLNDEGQPAKKSSMAFLYRSTTQGKPGKKGSVDVIDVPAHEALVIGLRGWNNPERIKEARQLLQQWLDEHAEEFAADGPFRVCGYNSPFVPDQQQFTEVTIPVRRLKDAEERPAGGDSSKASKP